MALHTSILKEYINGDISEKMFQICWPIPLIYINLEKNFVSLIVSHSIFKLIEQRKRSWKIFKKYTKKATMDFNFAMDKYSKITAMWYYDKVYKEKIFTGILNPTT